MVQKKDGGVSPGDVQTSGLPSRREGPFCRDVLTLDIMSSICTFLPGASVYTLVMVNREFAAAALSAEVWERLFLRDINPTAQLILFYWAANVPAKNGSVLELFTEVHKGLKSQWVKTCRVSLHRMNQPQEMAQRLGPDLLRARLFGAPEGTTTAPDGSADVDRDILSRDASDGKNASEASSFVSWIQMYQQFREAYVVMPALPPPRDDWNFSYLAVKLHCVAFEMENNLLGAQKKKKKRSSEFFRVPLRERMSFYDKGRMLLLQKAPLCALDIGSAPHVAPIAVHVLGCYFVAPVMIALRILHFLFGWKWGDGVPGSWSTFGHRVGGFAFGASTTTGLHRQMTVMAVILLLHRVITGRRSPVRAVWKRLFKGRLGLTDLSLRPMLISSVIAAGSTALFAATQVLLTPTVVYALRKMASNWPMAAQLSSGLWGWVVHPFFGEVLGSQALSFAILAVAQCSTVFFGIYELERFSAYQFVSFLTDGDVSKLTDSSEPRSSRKTVLEAAKRRFHEMTKTYRSQRVVFDMLENISIQVGAILLMASLIPSGQIDDAPAAAIGVLGILTRCLKVSAVVGAFGGLLNIAECVGQYMYW